MEPGVVIGGRYRLVEPLASGGMGTVWRARHVELDVDVAVKLMSDALSRTPTALARFQREAKAAAQLKSPHVVQVFDYGVDRTRPYLAMELLEGEDLRSHLERVGAMPLDRIAMVLDGLAKALRLAHAAGIVHRDLKPANVFLQRNDGDEIVKILDFGIAKDLGPSVNGLQTSSSSVVGSPLYMSPEQVRGSEVDHRTDVWALAVIAFEMATGRQPFEGASLGDVFARIIADDIPTATTVAPWLPKSLDTFFEKALARPVAKRFASAQDLADAFRASTGDAPSREVPEVRAAASPRALPDAPTIDASSPDAASAAAAASAVAAHTSARIEPSQQTVELARTVATPPPAVQTPSTPPVSGGRKTLAAIAAIVAAGAAIGTAIAVGSGGGGAPTESAVAESSKPELAAPGASAPSALVVEPSASAAASPIVAPAAASASPATSASASPATSASAPPTAAGRPPPRPPAPPPPRPPPAPAPGPATKPTTAIDPIFGVPVKKP